MSVALLRLWLLLGLALSACGAPANSLTPPDDAGDFGHEIDDAHLYTGCILSGDCDDNNPCTIDSCAPNHQCRYVAKDCSDPLDECSVGTCDRTTGTCGTEPGNEGMVCGATTPRPGHCLSGQCSPDPICTVIQSAFNCTYARVRSGTLGSASNIAQYSCGAGFDGPEAGYPLRLTTDRDLTLTLTGGTGDLDLLVLDGTQCTAAAACVAKSITAGSSAETVSFHAMADHDYTVVVESHAGSGGVYTLTLGCAGCVMPRLLACNQTVSGDTSRAGTSTGLGGYACTVEPGPEESYRFSQTIDTTYNLKLTGMQQDLDLVILGDYAGACDPTSCRAESVATGTTDEALSFTGYANAAAYAVVDSKGAGGPYQLEVSCPPSCKNNSTSFTCATPTDTRRNDDLARSRALVDNWSCDPGTTGPEVVYYLYSSSVGSYTFDLTGLTADLDLIVVEGSFSSCDPTAAGVASSVHAGTADESVTFTSKAGTYYWIAVDGKGGAVSPYVLKMHSPGCPGPSCYPAGGGFLACNYLDDQRRNDDQVRGKNIIDNWACDPGTSGPEVVYQFKPRVSGPYTVTLDGLSADLDLVVIENSQAISCDATTTCLASSTNAMTLGESLTFNADASKYYYIAVDGKAGAVSPYHVRMSSAACPAPVCQNSGRGLSCVATGRSLSYQNDQTGATSDVTDWRCATGESGPEMAHLFTPTGPGPYTVELIGLAADLDLLVLDAGLATVTNVCDPTLACLASSVAVGPAAEKLTFTADPTHRYWLIVDGKAGAISAYTLAITAGCPP